MTSAGDTNRTLTDRYFARIGLDKEQWLEQLRSEPLRALTAMIDRHTATIPFENIDALTDNSVKLDADYVADKLLEADRGGYCHEHSTLLASVFAELGIPTRRVGARIYAGRQLDAAPNKTHQALLVDVDGYYLIDAGFGGTTPLAPIPLADDTPVDTRAGQFRVIPADQTDYPDDATADISYMLQFRKSADAEFSSVYGFGTDPMPQADIEMANFFTSAHPDHFFTQQPVIALHTDDGKVTLSGLTLRGPEGERELASAEEFAEAVKDNFGIVLDPDVAERAYRKAEKEQRDSESDD